MINQVMYPWYKFLAEGKEVNDEEIMCQLCVVHIEICIDTCDVFYMLGISNNTCGVIWYMADVFARTMSLCMYLINNVMLVQGPRVSETSGQINDRMKFQMAKKDCPFVIP